MKSGYQREFPDRGQSQRFRSRGKGAVRVNHIQINHPDPVPVMRVQHSFPDLVLFQARHTAAHIFHQLVRESALKACIIHRGHHGHLVPHFAQRL